MKAKLNVEAYPNKQVRSVSIGYLKLELLDHWLAAEAQQQVIGCQGGHLIASGVGGTSNVGEDHCGKKKRCKLCLVSGIALV